jgi:hypothetical protein
MRFGRVNLRSATTAAVTEGRVVTAAIAFAIARITAAVIGLAKKEKSKNLMSMLV